MLYPVFLFFTLSQLFWGYVTVKKIFNVTPIVLTIISSFLIGVCITVPITYLLSCIFVFTGQPLLWGMEVIIGATIAFCFAYFRLLRQSPFFDFKSASKIRLNVSDILFFLFSLIFSSWLMMKTFRGGPGGQLFVGSNNIFDFGLFIGLVRSMSLGNNIPFLSPFYAGGPFFYHFLFQFWVSLWEYSGIPIVYAVNIPSIFSFTALLIIIYYIPHIIFKNENYVGWLAAIFTVTHATLTFWYVFIQKGFHLQVFTDIWRMPTYPFAGPFDGSVISIYTTLNSYVNQRHLAFGAAIGLFIYLVTAERLKQKQVSRVFCISIGLLMGFLFMWNMAICMISMVLIIVLFILFHAWKELLYVFISCSVGIGIFLSQYISYFIQTFTAVRQMVGGTYGLTSNILPAWNLGTYLWNNLSILPLIVCVGYFTIPKKIRVYIVPFILLFIVECILAGVGRRVTA